MNLNKADILRQLSKNLNQNLFNVRGVKKIQELLASDSTEGIPIVYRLETDGIAGFCDYVNTRIAGRKIIGIADVDDRIIISTLPDTAGPTVKEYFNGTEWQSITVSTFLSIFLFVEKV